MEYFISVNNEKRGPYSLDELRARGITSETLVMAENSDQWTPAWQIEELRNIINSATATKPVETDNKKFNESNQNAGSQRIDDFIEGVPLDESHSSSTQGTDARDYAHENYQQGSPVYPPHNPRNTEKKGGGCLTKFILLLIILALIVVGAIVTCPDENAHKAALNNVVASAISDEANDTDSTTDGSDVVSVVFSQISDSWTKEVVAVAVNNLIHVDNHIVFSVGKVRLAGKEHTVSIGVFGHVFTVDKDDLRKAAEGYYTKARKDAGDVLKQKTKQIIDENVIDPAEQAIRDLAKQSWEELKRDIDDSSMPSGDDIFGDPTDSIDGSN